MTMMRLPTQILQLLVWTETGYQTRWGYYLGEMVKLQDRLEAEDEMFKLLVKKVGSQPSHQLAVKMYLEVGPMLAEHKTILDLLQEKPELSKTLQALNSITEAIAMAKQMFWQEYQKQTDSEKEVTESVLKHLLETEPEMKPLWDDED